MAYFLVRAKGAACVIGREKLVAYARRFAQADLAGEVAFWEMTNAADDFSRA
jgi:hypothetical protein